MKKIISILIIFIFIQTNIFSQSISVYDHQTGDRYEVAVPDTLHVVFGKGYNDGEYSYIDYRDFIGFDIFFLDKPHTSKVYLSDYEVWERRIDPNYCREVFYDEYYTENIDLVNSLEIFQFFETPKISKFGFNYPILKRIDLIPYNIEGERITEKEYFNLKFALKNSLRLFNYKD
jgi:hypothetical protein